MKKTAIVFIFFILFLCGYSQKIQIIVPKQVVAGNAFQIQYIISDPSSLIDVTNPQFDNLNLISGPNYYKGSSLVNGKMQPIENITYTVVPVKAGTIKIHGLIANFKNDASEKTDDVVVTVVAPPKASFNTLSTYTDISVYTPSSKTDLEKLIDKNLFVRAEVDKETCFLGEAITATFKLYSRLQSTSEVINAPSLYGFSVMDILNINEAHQAVETIKGKVFNTSVLRKLQLYPAQTGKLTIDEMQLQNEIEFNDSITGKKFKVQRLLASNPVEINVKSLPSKQPANFTGAVGQFTIHAELQHSKMEANNQDKLIVTVAGKGNFIQFGTPIINWPKEFDVFDPLVSDEINKTSVPAEGERKYGFSFTSDQVGNFAIPPVSFSFFDPVSKTFKEVRTDSLNLEIVSSSKSGKSLNVKQQVQSTKNLWIDFAIGFLFVLTIIVFFFKKKRVNVQESSSETTSYIQKLNCIASLTLSDREFCSEIQKLLYEINKKQNLSLNQKEEIRSIQKDCQQLIYSNVNTEGQKEELQKRTYALLQQLS